MRQQLVKNLFFVLVINILVKAVWIFFIDRNVQLKVGYADYGSYQALFNLGIIFQILLDFGLTQYNSREIATDPKRIRVLFSSMFWTRILFSIVYTIIVLTVALALGYRSAQLSLLLGVSAILFLNSMLGFLRSNVAAMHHFRTDGVLAVVDRLLMIIVCGALLLLPLWFTHFRIEWFVWSQIICYLVAVIIAFIVLLKLTPVPIHFSIRPQIIRKVLRESAPYALLVFLMSIYMRSDAVMIERLCGNNGKMQAGIYASAFRLLDVANIFGLMFAGILMPMFAKMIAQKENIAPTIKLAVNIMMPLSFIAALMALFFGPEIMNLIYHKGSTAGDGKIFALLMCSFPPYCLMYIYSTLLTANGNIKLLNRISIFTVFLNLTLHYFLISSIQATGAAFGVLITEWTVAGVIIFYAHRKFILPHNYKWIAAHIGFVLCIISFAAGINLLGINWMLKLTIDLVFSIFLLFLFQFWSIDSLKELLQRKR